MKIAGRNIHWSLATLGAIFGLFVLLQIATFAFLQPLVGQVIRTSVSYFSDDLYQIDFKKVRVRLFRKAIQLEEVTLTYDTARVQASAHLRQSKHYTGTIRDVTINLRKFTYFLSGRYLAVDGIRANRPVVYAHRFPEVVPSDSSSGDTTSLDFNTFHLIKPYFDSIAIDQLTVREASVGVVQHRPSASSDTTQVEHISILIEEAHVDSVAASQARGWPRMQTCVLSLRDQTFTSADSLYHYQVDSVRVNPLRGTLLVEQFAILPQWDRYEMGERMGQIINWRQLNVAQVNATGIDFTALTDSLMIRAHRILVKEADFTLFRDIRLPRGEPTFRPLLQAMLRSAPVPFWVDTVTLEQGSIRYEERRASTDQAGYITFDSTYASLYHFTNCPADSAATLRADVSTHLMGTGDATMHFTFPLTSTLSEHQITGTLDRMSLDALNPTTEPLALVSVKSGMNNRMDFDIQLNEKYATGNVRFQYENLKLSLLREGGASNKKGVKSWLANTLVVKDSNPVRTKPLRPGPIQFERDTTRSMFNYWWRALRSGLEVSVGVGSPS